MFRVLKKATPDPADPKNVASQALETKAAKEEPETAKVATEHNDQAVATSEATDEAQATSPSSSELDSVTAMKQLPETYGEWVSTAFSQLSVRRSTEFLPHDPLESARSARPLKAANALTWWLVTFAIFLLMTILLLDFGAL